MNLKQFAVPAGTFLSGLSVLCCGLVRPSGGDILNVIWVNSWVALLQFFTTVIFLFGWVWSIVWAFAFLDLSSKSTRVKVARTVVLSDR